MLETKCYKCGFLMTEKIVEVKTAWGDYELTINGVSALKCDNCGEVIYRTEDVRMIQKLSESLSQQSPKVTYLNLADTAKIFKVSNQTVYNMIKDGRIKAYKIGREWRFLASDIYAFKNDNDSSSNIQIAAKGGKIDDEDLQKIMSELEKERQKS